MESPIEALPVRFIHENDTLSFGSTILRTEDVITVVDNLHDTRANAHNYTIFSLTQLPSEPQVLRLPFELKINTATTLPSSFLAEHTFKLPCYLQPNNEVYILISTLSGTGLAQAFFDEILQPLLRGVGLLDKTYSIVKTKSAETLRNFAKNTILAGANAGKSQTVLMLSGDGGIVDTINGLLEGKNRSRYTKPALVQIPLGTGNALFHSLHRQSSLISFHLQGLRSLLFGSPKPLPIFKATFSPGAQLLSNEGQTATLLNNNVLYGAVVVSYGLHSTLVADSDTTEYRKHGDRRFGLVANDLLFPKDGSSPHAYYASISLDEKPIEEKFHGYVLASLVSNLEKTFTISPNSEPLDGKLRVVRFGPIDGTLAMEVMKNAYEGGKHVNMDVVEYSTVEKIRVVFHEASDNWMWRRCCIDGLIIAVEKDGWMEVEMVENGEEAVMIVVDAD